MLRVKLKPRTVTCDEIVKGSKRLGDEFMKKLAPEMYKKKGSSRDANVPCLNDIIIGDNMEVEGG